MTFKGPKLFTKGGIAFIPNPFLQKEVNTKILAITIIDRLYKNAQRENIKNLTLDDVADASYPSIDLEQEKLGQVNRLKEDTKEENQLHN